MNRVYLLIGSNIEPEQNIRSALQMLQEIQPIKRCSRIWKTAAYGNSGPDFLNIVIKIETLISLFEYKEKIITRIETALKRKRFPDKNAPRTIDIDILIFGDQIIEPEIGTKFFITIPLADLLPEWIDPTSGKSLKAIQKEIINDYLFSIQ